MSVRPQNHRKRSLRNNLSSLFLLHLTLVNGEHQSHNLQPPTNKQNRQFTLRPSQGKALGDAPAFRSLAF